MKVFECACGSKDIFIKEKGNNKGLYCADCGKWLQWLGKEDYLLAQRQIELSIVQPMEVEYRKGYNKAIDDFKKKIQSRKEYFEEYYPKDSIAISEANVYLEIANELKHLN